MKKILLLSVFIACCANQLFAQDDGSQTYTRDIGFNTTFILQGILQSGQTPFSLMFKKYTAENKAIRIGADVFFNLDDTNANSGSTYYFNNSAASVYLAIGKEFQKPIDKRWTWYFGGDVVPFYTMANQDYYALGTLNSESENNSVGVGLRPFLGIRFNLNPRLYLSAEANLGLQYAYRTNTIQYTDTSEPTVDNENNNISFSMNPASGLFLYYRF